MSDVMNNVPELRFPEFSDAWQVFRTDEVIERTSSPVDVQEESFYRQIGIRSHGKGIFHKDEVSGLEIGNKRVFWIEQEALVLNIVFAWEQAVAKISENEIGMIASHRFPMFVPKQSKSSIDFLLYLFLTKRGKHYLGLASPGGAGRNKTLGQKEFSELKVKLPAIKEQQKIADFLSSVDKKIEQLTEKHRLFTEYKKGVMKQIFTQQIRFKDNQGNYYPEWEEVELGEVLDYLQPTKYLVKDTDYSDEFSTPVLTAGKTFVLGYSDEKQGIFKELLPAIIFDDFTTAFKYVDFPFKAKSSAMKILIAKEGLNIKYIFEAMQTIRFEVGGHERHWISKFSKLAIPYPAMEEQQKIANFLTEIDQKIDQAWSTLEQTKVFKNGLLQKMFV